jgi:D-alanyl-D-alanine carboxypeptidase/D-alanyl-D-alanine-endopeptidase (penicillin-binding protein 4)
MALWGSVPRTAQPWSSLLAIDDPALYAATALEDALTRRGVSVGGSPVARHLHAQTVADLESGPVPAPPGAGLTVLATRQSPPLSEIAQVVNKVSQNLHAEILLREVARRRRGIGSRQAGLREMEAFLAELGVPREEYRFEDGSGLSRLTLVTPHTVATLLQFMYRSPNREAWMASLPVAGVDGTLARRFENRAAAARNQAKTGSLSHVSALGGYGRRRDGSVVTFSLMVNNYNARDSEVRLVMDRIALAMIGEAPAAPKRRVK